MSTPLDRGEVADSDYTIPGSMIELDAEDVKDRGHEASVAADGAKPGGKRKKEASLPDDGDMALTLNTFKELLEQQTHAIRRSNAEEIQKAVEVATKASGEEIHKAINKATAQTTAQLSRVEATVGRHSDALTQIRDDMETMEARLSKVEGNVASSTGSTMWAESDKKRSSLIFGGWPEDTPREVLLQELWDLLSKAGLDGEFEDIFTTGPRRGFAIGNVKMEGFTDAGKLKRKLIEMTIIIRKARLCGKHMQSGKYLWANLSKTKTERDRGSHGGKLKRLILELSGGYDPGIEVEYPAGTAWLPAGIIGSATKPQPTDAKTVPGRVEGTWMNVTRVATAFNMAEQEVENKWREILE